VPPEGAPLTPADLVTPRDPFTRIPSINGESNWTNEQATSDVENRLDEKSLSGDQTIDSLERRPAPTNTGDTGFITDYSIGNITPGNDIIIGTNRGDPLRSGDAGNDFIDGLGGPDLLDYKNETGDRGITAILPGQFVRDTHGDIDTVRNIESITGTDKADILVGDEQANHLNGLSGGDTIYGGGGEDTIKVGTAGDESDRYSRNVVDGGSGADYISSGYGNNTITGGSDQDIFDSRDVSGRDVITDFTVGEDIFKLPVGVLFNDLVFTTYNNFEGSGTQFSLANKLVQFQNVRPEDLSKSDFSEIESRITGDV